MQANDADWMSAWEKGERPYPWSREHFNEAWIQEEKGKPAGYVVFKTVADEAHLLNIMVRPDLRRAGLGRRMMQETFALALARGARYMILDVDPQNVPALALYRQTGFSVLERRAQAYPRGEDALIMRKELS
jgi:ribosomal-protein-alanine N-acetyltransferase